MSLLLPLHFVRSIADLTRGNVSTRSAYGQLKSVRLPRKMDNSTRGFAFLDFATRRDAEAAFSALEHAHLLGRHLVLQWAGEDGEDGVKDQLPLESGRLSHKKAKFTLDTDLK